MTRQQAAPLQGAHPSPSGCEHSQPRSPIGSPLGALGPLPEVGSPLLARAALGRCSQPVSRAQPAQGARKVQRGAGEGWGRKAGPARRQQPAYITTQARLRPQQKTPRPLPPPPQPRTAGNRVAPPPHPQRWGGQRYLVARGSVVLSTPSSWFESSAGFPPGRSPHTTGREQPKPKAEKTPNSSRPG